MQIECVFCRRTTNSIHEPWRHNVEISGETAKGVCPQCKRGKKSETTPQTVTQTIGREVAHDKAGT